MLSIEIGNIHFENCLMNASGCWCTTEQELNDLNNSESGAIVTKSSTLTSRYGNKEPRIFIDDIGSINAMGIPNHGYNFYLDYGMSLCNKNVYNKPYIQSIHPFTLDELTTMLYDIGFSGTNKLVEINIACPNILNNNFGFEKFELYMDRLNQNHFFNTICGFKLPPFHDLNHFDVMSRLLLKYNINFITSINSLANGLIIDPMFEKTRIYPNNGLGGIGGKYCKPIGLSNVYNFHRRLENKVNIIGCGGISNGIDVFEYILCGAKAVQIGTHLLKQNPSCFKIIRDELIEFMKIKKYASVNDLCGRINYAHL
jgi:dihydroorotate dehydrogenase (fumarate)